MAEQQLTEEQVKAIQEKLKKMSPEELDELIKQQCVFCKIASGAVESKVVYSDDNVMAALDVQPANPGHVLIFPKKHYSIIQQMPDAEVARLFALVKYVSGAVFEATGAEGTNVMVASGAVAGQRAPHVLVHVIPRFEKDGMPQQWWEPKKIKDEQMGEIAKKISEALKTVKPKALVEEAPKKEEKKETGRKVLRLFPRRP